MQHVRGAGRGWANGRLVYTHGYGAFRISGTKISPTEEPRANNRAVPLRQPRIYFGEQQSGAPGWVVVNSRRAEFDRPVAGGPARRFDYTGSGGISLSSPFVRAMFALRQGSLPLLVSKQITDRSRIILHRDVIERLKTVAPFIRWEQHPTALVVGGRIVFLAAGYTESDSYPYAHRTRVAGSFANYARAAVQATVDAYSGRIRLYPAVGRIRSCAPGTRRSRRVQTCFRNASWPAGAPALPKRSIRRPGAALSAISRDGPGGLRERRRRVDASGQAVRSDRGGG